MNNLEKYNQAFIEVFGVEENALGSNFNKDSVDGWDSVHQLNIIALLEESFDIMYPKTIELTVPVQLVKDATGAVYAVDEHQTDKFNI